MCRLVTTIILYKKAGNYIKSYVWNNNQYHSVLHPNLRENNKSSHTSDSRLNIDIVSINNIYRSHSKSCPPLAKNRMWLGTENTLEEMLHKRLIKSRSNIQRNYSTVAEQTVTHAISSIHHLYYWHISKDSHKNVRRRRANVEEPKFHLIILYLRIWFTFFNFFIGGPEIITCGESVKNVNVPTTSNFTGQFDYVTSRREKNCSIRWLIN